MTQVKDDIETAVEKSDSTDLEKDQVKGSIDVLKTDEESAIEGYEDFKSETEKVADKELADAVNDQMEEIVDDEKEHIEKLDTIKSALGENKKTEAKVKRNNSKKRLDYKLDGFKGVTIIVVDKKNNIDTEDYMKFDSMEFGIDEYEFEDSMIDGIKDILTDIYEYTDDYYDDRFTKDEITEMAEDITQDVLQLYDDLPEENIDRENGIANLGESKEARLTGDETYVARNSSGYKSIGLIVNNETKQFQIINGQVMTTDSKTKKMSKKQIRAKAQQLYDNGYTEYDGYGSVAQGVEKKTEAEEKLYLDGKLFDKLEKATELDFSNADIDILKLMYKRLDDLVVNIYDNRNVDDIETDIKNILSKANVLVVKLPIITTVNEAFNLAQVVRHIVGSKLEETFGYDFYYESRKVKKEDKQNITEDTASSEFNLYIKPEELADVNISSLLFDSDTTIASYKEGNYELSLIVRGSVKIWDNENGYCYKNYQSFPVDLQSLIRSGALKSGDDTNKYTVDMSNWFEWFLDVANSGDVVDNVWNDVADIEGMLNKATPEENETELEIIMKDLFDDIVGQLNESKEVKTETVKIMAYGKLYYEYSNDEWNSKSEDEKDATIIDVADQATEEEGHTVYEDEVEVITENRKVTEAKDDLEGIKNLIVYEKTQAIFEELYHNEHLDCEYNGSSGVVKITSVDEQTFNIIDKVMVDNLHYSKLSNYVYELNEGPIYRDIKGGFDFKGYSYKVDVKFSLNEKDTIVGTVGISEIDVKKENKNLTEDITSKDVDEIFSKYAETPVTVKNLKQKWASASDEMHGVIAGGWSAIITGNNFKIKVVNSLKLSGYKISGENIEEAEKAARKIYINATEIGYNTGLYESKEVKTEKMGKDADKKYSNLYKYKGKAFAYDNENAIVEYVYVDPEDNSWIVLDEIGLSNDNWEDRKLRDAYLDEYIRQLDDEANRLADDFIANEFLGESLNQKINRKLQESREKFDRDELVAVKDSIDTALDDLQIQSDGTTGAMADKVLVNDLRNVSQSVGNYLNKVQEGKDLKHPELNNSVKAYYADAFGKDELNADIKEVTFLDLYRALKNKQDVYDLIGVRDSVVRERLFAELARILNQPIAYVNNIWQYGVEDGQPNIVKEDKETGTIRQSLNTGVLPIVNVDLYSLYSSGWFDNLVLDDDSNAKFDEIIQDIAPRFIKETLQDILPSVEIYATGVYHPREYNYGGDELEFDLVVNADEYNALKEKALSSDMFETYLKDNYSSRSGFISSMPDDIDEFNNADEWKQMVQVIMFALKDTALTDVNEAYLNDFSDAVNQEFPYVDGEIDNAIDELEYKASKENITLDVDYVTNYIKEQFGNTDSYDYILDKVLSGLNLTESAKVDEAKKEELFNTDVNVNVDAGDIASGNNLDLGGLGHIASAVGLMASEENTKSGKEKLAEDSDDEIPVVNPDEQDYYDNKGYIISLYPRSRSNVNII